MPTRRSDEARAVVAVLRELHGQRVSLVSRWFAIAAQHDSAAEKAAQYGRKCEEIPRQLTETGLGTSTLTGLVGHGGAVGETLSCNGAGRRADERRRVRSARPTRAPRRRDRSRGRCR